MSLLFSRELSDLIKTVVSAGDPNPTVIREEENYLNKDLDREIKIEELKIKKEFTELLKQNRAERKKYARHIFRFTCIWATLIFLIIIAGGIRSINGASYFKFEISDKVLITLITSTTINFFGFFLLVVKYLFHIETNETDKKKKKILKQGTKNNKEDI